jgi:antimicrobial peptide system SdpA family protein
LSSISYNPIRYQFPNQKKVLSFIPQGWAFFTRSPREAQILVYQIENNKIKNLEISRHSSPMNYFGFNRKQTYKMNELQFIIDQFEPKDYTTISWNYKEDLQGEIPTKLHRVSSIFKHSLLKNKEILLVMQEIVPWAWSSKSNLKMPAKAIKMYIQ